MIWTVRIDYASVKNICKRLGIERETCAENQKPRDIVLFALSKDVDTLNALAKRDSISLYDLEKCGLLPSVIGDRVYMYAPRNKSACTEETEFFYKDIGELTGVDCIRFSKCRHTGEATIAVLKNLIDVYRETSGFKTLTAARLSAEDQIRLIGRIVESVCTDPKTQRKLSAMFPAPKF